MNNFKKVATNNKASHSKHFQQLLFEKVQIFMAFYSMNGFQNGARAKCSKSKRRNQFRIVPRIP
jgi:hypothetical protein